MTTIKNGLLILLAITVSVLGWWSLKATYHHSILNRGMHEAKEYHVPLKYDDYALELTTMDEHGRPLIMNFKREDHAWTYWVISLGEDGVMGTPDDYVRKDVIKQPRVIDPIQPPSEGPNLYEGW